MRVLKKPLIEMLASSVLSVASKADDLMIILKHPLAVETAKDWPHIHLD